MNHAPLHRKTIGHRPRRCSAQDTRLQLLLLESSLSCSAEKYVPRNDTLNSPSTNRNASPAGLTGLTAINSGRDRFAKALASLTYDLATLLTYEAEMDNTKMIVVSMKTVKKSNLTASAWM